MARALGTRPAWRKTKNAGLERPFGPSSGATLLSILEVEIYFEYVEARVCQDGGCEARALSRRE